MKWGIGTESFQIMLIRYLGSSQMIVVTQVTIAYVLRRLARVMITATLTIQTWFLERRPSRLKVSTHQGINPEQWCVQNVKR